MNSDNPILEIKDLRVYFKVRSSILSRQKGGWVRAVDGVSLTIEHGEIMGLVGESGSGKSTLGLAILQLVDIISGSVRFDGEELTTLNRRELSNIYHDIQMVFQNPIASLNPRMTAKDIIQEPLEILNLGTRDERAKRVNELLELVSLDPYFSSRYPHEFSGGQCQRIGIARALAVQPSFLILDEPVSALDVSIQAQIINLLRDLRDKLGLTYLFIGHNLSLVRHISDRVAVMYSSKLVEFGECDQLYNNPLHPYTKALLQAEPIPDPEVEEKRNYAPLKGEIPSPLNPPSGCRFHPRCPIAIQECRQAKPHLVEKEEGHYVACNLV